MNQDSSHPVGDAVLGTGVRGLDHDQTRVLSSIRREGHGRGNLTIEGATRFLVREKRDDVKAAVRLEGQDPREEPGRVMNPSLETRAVVADLVIRCPQNTGLRPSGSVASRHVWEVGLGPPLAPHLPSYAVTRTVCSMAPVDRSTRSRDPFGILVHAALSSGRGSDETTGPSPTSPTWRV